MEEKSLQAVWNSSEALERQARAASSLVTPESEEDDRRWILSDVGKLHRESSGFVSAPAYRWRCGCRWAFGTGRGCRFLSEQEARSHSGSLCNGGCDLT